MASILAIFVCWLELIFFWHWPLTGFAMKCTHWIRIIFFTFFQIAKAGLSSLESFEYITLLSKWHSSSLHLSPGLLYLEALMLPAHNSCCGESMWTHGPNNVICEMEPVTPCPRIACTHLWHTEGISVCRCFPPWCSLDLSSHPPTMPVGTDHSGRSVWKP